MEVDNSNQSFLYPDDPARIDYDAFRDQFGQDESILVVLGPPSIYDLAFLENLRSIHRDIEQEVPYIGDIVSLWNARYSRGEEDELVVEDLMEEWPENEADLAALRKKVLENPLYRDRLVTTDEALTIMVLKPFIYSSLGPQGGELEGFDDAEGAASTDSSPEKPDFITDVEEQAIVYSLRKVLERYEDKGFGIYLVGGPVFNVYFNEVLGRDLVWYVAGCAGTIALLLLVLMRRVSGVLVPLVVVFASLLATFGVQVLIGIPMSVVIQIVPVLLLTAGVCDAVHILVIVYQQLDEGRPKDDAIVFALKHSGLAVLMTSVTTAGGLASFVLAEMAPVAALGKLAPIGVMLAFLYTVVLLPALLKIFPLSQRAAISILGSSSGLGAGWLSETLASVGTRACRNPGAVLGVTTLLVLLAATGMTQLYFAQDSMAWFPEDDPIRMEQKYLDGALNGIFGLSIWVDTRSENGLHDPEVLNRMERLILDSIAREDLPLDVTNASSMLDVLKETHKSLNANQTDYFAIPQDRRLIARELLLFENGGSDDLEDYVDSQFQSAAIELRVREGDGVNFLHLMQKLEPRFEEILGEEIDFKLTGGGALFSAVFLTLNQSMSSSYLIALMIITPLMILLIGNIHGGLVSMIPNLLPIILTLGLMGWWGIPLDMSTLLIGGLVIGIAVDDTIHFMYKFQRYLLVTGDAEQAVRATLLTTGSALLYTTLVLTSGFLVIGMSYMVNMQWFGFLASFATACAFLADIIVGPALMGLLYRKKLQPN